tara:strand:- start:11166 stop:12566 length:1401 start_codon:yes stop_codon:yes gene_type:complete
MGFNFGAFLAGGAEAIKEEADQERQDVKELFNTSAKLWTEMGITNLQTNRAKRKELNKIADRLQKIGNNNNQFLSKDQIAAVLGQGKGDEVAKTLERFNTEGLSWSPADIVNMGENYKSTNKTIETHLDEILGNVKSGTTYSDALIDSQPETLSEKIGLFSSKDYIKQRVDTYGSVLGKDLAELQALAMDDREFGEYPTAQIKLGLPVETGLKITMSQLKRDFTDSIARQLGVELTYQYDSANQEYKPVFSKEQAQLQNKVLAAVDKALNDFDTFIKTDTNKTQLEIKQGITNNILGNKLATDPDRYITKDSREVKTEQQIEDELASGKQTIQSFNKSIDEIIKTKDYREGSPIKKQDLILDEMLNQLNQGGLLPNVITDEVVQILQGEPFNKNVVDSKNIVNTYLEKNKPKPNLNQSYPENELGFNLPKGYVEPRPPRSFFTKDEYDKWNDDYGKTHLPSGKPKA